MEEAQRAPLERHSEFDEAVRELHRAEAALGEVETGLAIIESHAGRLLGSTPRVCSSCGASKRDVAKLIAGPLCVHAVEAIAISAGLNPEGGSHTSAGDPLQDDIGVDPEFEAAPTGAHDTDRCLALVEAAVATIMEATG